MRLLICFLLAVTGWTQTGMMRVQRRAVGFTTPATCGNTAAVSAPAFWATYAAGHNGCVPAAASSVVSCVVDLAVGGHNGVGCAIYATSAGAPTGSPLCSGTNADSVDGENTITLSGCGTLASGTTYALIQSTPSGNVQNAVAASSATGYYASTTYPTWPSAGWSTDSGVALFRVYLHLLQ